MKQTKTPHSAPKPGKRKRRLKKSVKRGCMGFVLAAVVIISLSVYECTRERHASDMPEPAFPTLPPDGTDSLVAARVMRSVLTAPCIDTSRLAISIFDLDRNCPVLEHRSQCLMAPASCMKLLTAIAAYRMLGLDHQYRSHLLVQGTRQGCKLRGNVILQADDDPQLLSLDDFAQALRQKGITEVEGNIEYNLARRDTLRQHPTASPWDISYAKVPILMKGEGRIRQEFQAALTRAGISVNPAEQPLHGNADTILTISHTLREVCAPMVIHSSNIKAEAVYYHLHHHMARLQPAQDISTLPLLQRFMLDELGMVDFERYTVLDGSGLSPQNRLTTSFLTRLLTYAFRHDDLRQVLIDETLATPGHPERHGSLMGRMNTPTFHGKVFCKTGTLTTIGTSSLAGYAQGADGRWFAFAIITGQTPVADSRNMQDDICKAMVRF